MHRSAVPNRAANSRSPAIRSPLRRSGLCYPKARWPTRTFIEPVLTGQGYRPKRTAHDAIKRVAEAIVQRKTRVLDFAFRSYFDNVRHVRLSVHVAQRV